MFLSSLLIAVGRGTKKSDEVVDDGLNVLLRYWHKIADYLFVCHVFSISDRRAAVELDTAIVICC